MTLSEIESAATRAGLFVMGAYHPDRSDGGGTRVLLGCGPGFWPIFTSSPEYHDQRPDPVDRWSKRVIGALARDTGANDSYPSDGPPYAPFIAWALATGRFFNSPVGMMVHDRVGMMISIRGALSLDAVLAIPETAAPSPCAACPAPCATACPVGALSADAPYDVPRCHDFLSRAGAESCMMQGCIARRACPLSQGAGRQDAQSELHMRSFHPS